MSNDLSAAAVVDPAPFHGSFIALGTAAELVVDPLTVISNRVPPLENP